jgi:hypothetical protein
MGAIKSTISSLKRREVQLKHKGRFTNHKKMKGSPKGKKSSPMQLTDHHVPPKHPNSQPQFVLKKRLDHHRAYHLLFNAASSFEDAVAILKKDWWTPGAHYPSSLPVT